MARVDGDRVVEELVRLAQRELTGAAPLGTVRSLPDLRRRPAAGVWRLRVAGVVVLGATAALLWILGTSWFAKPAPITYRVVDGAVVAGAVVGSQTTRLRFSEGSEVALSQGAEAVVDALEARGATLRVRRGRARVAIQPLAEAAWVVLAGPNSVRVTGTEFDVAWNEGERTLEVAMLEGTVEVTGEALKAPVRLRAGQRLRRRGLEAPSVDWVTPASAEQVPTPAALPTATANAAPSAAAPTPQTALLADGAARATDASWSRRVAQGKFEEVIAEAERQGIDAVVSRASLTELSALADAARYARRSRLAERVLLAERQRFGSSGAARDAAFLLGQLAESEGRGALAWYDTYLREAPDGVYAPQALGRKMMLAYEGRSARGADTFAREYLARYPRGPYAAAARKIISEANGRSPH